MSGIYPNCSKLKTHLCSKYHSNCSEENSTALKNERSRISVGVMMELNCTIKRYHVHGIVHRKTLEGKRNSTELRENERYVTSEGKSPNKRIVAMSLLIHDLALYFQIGTQPSANSFHVTIGAYLSYLRCLRHSYVVKL